jgi:hypothetical protein
MPYAWCAAAQVAATPENKKGINDIPTNKNSVAGAGRVRAMVGAGPVAEARE